MLRAGKALHTFIRQVTTANPNTLTTLKAVLEDAAYGAPSRITVAKLKELTGVYKFILDAHGIDWLDCSPSAAKRLVAGKGNAEKFLVAREIEARYGIRFDEDKGWDLSDATALALWGMKR
jgi:Holliday junction resolvasome RuvABC endonuclease subunit